MAIDITQFDLEQMNNAQKARAPFGRRRALGIMSGALFGLATRGALPKRSSANHLAVPQYCYGAARCHGCSFTTCTTCGGVGSYNCQNVSGRQCWYTYGYDAVGCYAQFRCCDWIESSTGTVCICRGQTNTYCR